MAGGDITARGREMRRRPSMRVSIGILAGAAMRGDGLRGGVETTAGLPKVSPQARHERRFSRRRALEDSDICFPSRGLRTR
jgi:hypothetical protein